MRLYVVMTIYLRVAVSYIALFVPRNDELLIVGNAYGLYGRVVHIVGFSVKLFCIPLNDISVRGPSEDVLAALDPLHSEKWLPLFSFGLGTHKRDILRAYVFPVLATCPGKVLRRVMRHWENKLAIGIMRKDCRPVRLIKVVLPVMLIVDFRSGVIVMPLILIARRRSGRRLLLLSHHHQLLCLLHHAVLRLAEAATRALPRVHSSKTFH